MPATRQTLHQVPNAERGSPPPVASDEPDDEGDLLSVRESDVLRLMAEGLGEKQIARSLSVSCNTVHTYKARVFRKLQVNSSANAIHWFYEHQVVPAWEQVVGDPFAALSAREHQVILLLATGLSRKEIAEKLCIAFSTVRSHIERAFDKLNVRNRRAVISLALRMKVDRSPELPVLEDVIAPLPVLEDAIAPLPEIA